MMTHAEIRFTRKSYEDGFGFSCMKAAYRFGITGRMDYSEETGIRIQAEGDPAGITEFLKWLEQNVADASHLFTQLSNGKNAKFREFDIYRHSS